MIKVIIVDDSAIIRAILEQNLKKESDIEIIDSVSNGENCRYTLGYSIYLYAKEQYVRDNVKFVKIDGIEVSDENITNKSYPLTKVVYAVMRKDEPEDSNARKLVDFLLNTEKGQETVVAGGYVRMK